MFSLRSVLFIFLLSGTLFANEVSYSDARNSNTYTVSSPDGTISAEISADGGRAINLSINGDWNRLSNAITIEDRKGELYNFDFAFGTYTTLATTAERPSYNVKAGSNDITLTASATVDNKKINIQRTLVFLSNGVVQENIILSNTTGSDVSLDFEGLAFSVASLFDIARATTNNNNLPEYRYMTEKKLEKGDVHGGSWFGGPKPMDFIDSPKWMTIADNFFLGIIQPNFSNTVAIYHGLEFAHNSRVNMGVQVLATNIAPKTALTYQLQYYVGPRSENIVGAINTEYKKMFAWPFVFNWILKPIESGTIWVMSTLVNMTGSAGLTLILIAILVKLILLPLSIKSAISMKKMRVLQPKLNKLQEKWGHDQQALQVKTMELYKSEKVNPLGGCLPLLLQIPVFFALFRVLSRSVDLRGANFLWINDLTMPDTLFMVGSFSFHLLPIIMTIMQLVSVFLQQGRMGASQNEMQKQMQTQSYLMPVIFLFLFWGMPSGLVLYWTVQNIVSIIEQEIINLDARIAKKTI